MKALWLASWYPNKLSPFNGDFIKRHAEAVSGYDDVHVIYVVRDEKGMVTKEIKEETFTQGRLTETIIYYHLRPGFIKALDKWRSSMLYSRLLKQAIFDYIKKNGNPGIVHVQVGMKAGMMARWLYRKMNIPYVVSEHWSGFLPEATYSIKHLPVYYRTMWKRILQQAKGCSVVSNHLAKGVESVFGITCRVIANVVNTQVFYPAPSGSGKWKFMHISGLDDLKNPRQVLDAFDIARQTHPAITLDIFGSRREDIMQYAETLKLTDQVSFHEEVPQTVLAKQLNDAVGLILYSSYETFGCVIIEANACGVPVVVSDIPVFHETVTEGENGYFAPLAHPPGLASRMLDIIEHRLSFDGNKIAAETAAKYSYAVIGKQISDWYEEVSRGALPPFDRLGALDSEK
jgi:glycosyltransferase involved in cell wall biosynthesis